MSEAELKKLYDEYWAYSDEVDPVCVESQALHPAGEGRVVRVRDGQVQVTDGPFSETKEQLGGFYHIKVESLDEAIEWAGRIPSVPIGATIEIRPLAGQRVES